MFVQNSTYDILHFSNQNHASTYAHLSSLPIDMCKIC